MLFAGRTFNGDRAMLALQRQLALGAEPVPDPPLKNGSNLSAPTIEASAAVALAALVAAVFVLLPGAGQHTNETSPDLPVLIVKSVKPAEMQSATAPPPFIRVPEEALRGVPNSKPETSPIADHPPSRPASNLPPSVATSEPALDTMSSFVSTIKLTSDEIAMLLNRGEDFFKDGDLVSARLLFRRAATAGNAEAAFVLGRTFDPAIANRMGIIGIKPDMASARQWYERAAELGSPEASQELARLQRCHW
jgi:Sel1 repeat